MKLPFCLAIVVATILLLGITTAYAQQQEEKQVGLELGVQHPDFSFFPYQHGALHPTLPPSNDDEFKCFRAVHAHGMTVCLKDLRSFFMTHKVSVSAGCCSALEKIEKSCKHTSLFLKNFVSHHCSGAGPSSS